MTDLCRSIHVDFFEKSWRLIIGYYRIEVDKSDVEESSSKHPNKKRRMRKYIVYNLVLRWRPNHDDANTYLCLEQRNDHQNCFTTEVWEKNAINHVEFLAEKELFKNLISCGGFQGENKLERWNARFKTRYTKNTGWTRCKPAAALIPYTTSINLIDNNKDPKASTTLKRYRSKSGNKKCRVLPNSPLNSGRNKDIDLFRDSNQLQGFFGEEIPSEKLTAAIGALEYLIDENVKCQSGAKLKEEDRNMLIGALADRFYSHQGWRLKPYEPISDAQFDKSSVHLDIDQVALEIDDMGNCNQLENFWQKIAPRVDANRKRKQLIPIIQSEILNAKETTERVNRSFCVCKTNLEETYNSFKFEEKMERFNLEMTKGIVEAETLISEFQIDHDKGMTEAEFCAEMVGIVLDTKKLRCVVTTATNLDPDFDVHFLELEANLNAYAFQYLGLKAKMEAGILKWMECGGCKEKNLSEKQQQEELQVSFAQYKIRKRNQSENQISKMKVMIQDHPKIPISEKALTDFIETIRDDSHEKLEEVTFSTEPTIIYEKVKADIECLKVLLQSIEEKVEGGWARFQVRKPRELTESTLLNFKTNGSNPQEDCEIDYGWKRVNKISSLSLFGSLRKIDENLKSTVIILFLLFIDCIPILLL